MPYVNIDVHVDLDEISDDDLLEELERRNLLPDKSESLDYKELVEKIYLKRMFGLDFLKETDELIYNMLGRIV